MRSKRQEGGGETADLGQPASWNMDAYFLIAQDGTIIWCDPSARSILGCDPRGRCIRDYVAELRRPIPLPPASEGTPRPEGLPDAPAFARTLEVTPTDDAQDWLLVRVRNQSDDTNRIRELERLALHDSLTGLPNRSLFADRLDQALLAAERSGAPLAILLVDLDRFKEVNDTLGHEVGDRLLAAVAPRLGLPLRRADTLARLGGDEFGILLAAAAPMASACQVAERLVECFREPFRIDGLQLELGISIGVALHPDHGLDRETLLRHADLAMYRAKRANTGFVVFAEADSQLNRRRLVMQRDLARVVAEGGLALEYQLTFRAGSRSPTGVEALLRWPHDELGLLYPADFLPIAQRTGLTPQLTLWVLETCLRDARMWRDGGLALDMAINVDSGWVRDRAFPAVLEDALRRAGRPAGELTLEVAERSIMRDPEAAGATLHAVAEVGCRLAINDFGTGYSSLVHLQRLPIAELKVHPTFTTVMTSDREGARVVRSIIRLARGFGLAVTAAGVEDEAAARRLERWHCDRLQGFHLARPMAANAIADAVMPRGLLSKASSVG